ncbi:Putative ATP-dependent dethiobiotin synthetase [Madurella fahalii]|uniref:ATP-dependent dethiobiotin synthetase n=1 Tax=Madurella fahalii TaxID=1157608 RepID=A0ABQ0GQN2_9PEZI
MVPTLVAWLFLSARALVSPTARQASENATCTRDQLRTNTEIYLAAQAAGKPDDLVALSGANFTYTEDFQVRDITKGHLITPIRLDHNRSIFDTTQCATYTELISADPETPRVIGTQMRFDPTGKELVKMETLVTMPGDWAFNATQTLAYAAREDGLWSEIPEEDRDSREVIQAAGDAYLDLFNNASVVVPWGTPCNRLEGGWYTGNFTASDSCNVGVPSGVAITQRRYVIDEVLGTVDCFVVFGTRPDSHEFRVEKGKLRFVHTMTVMRNVTA